MQYSKGSQGGPDLVGLEMADEVPCRREALQPELCDLRDTFLNAVFTEIGDAGVGRGRRPLGGERLGNGDQRHAGGIASGAVAGCGNAVANKRNSLG